MSHLKTHEAQKADEMYSSSDRVEPNAHGDTSTLKMFAKRSKYTSCEQSPPRREAHPFPSLAQQPTARLIRTRRKLSQVCFAAQYA